MTGTLGGHGASHEYLLWLAAIIAFAVTSVGLLLVLRRVSRRVELERAEAILADEIDGLNGS